MHRFMASAAWDEKAILRAARDHLLPQVERHAPIGAWVVDDTGMPKRGRHSVGVAPADRAGLGRAAGRPAGRRRRVCPGENALAASLDGCGVRPSRRPLAPCSSTSAVLFSEEGV
jgi:hypothetical protein